jgi:hypothetical protein
MGSACPHVRLSFALYGATSLRGQGKTNHGACIKESAALRTNYKDNPFQAICTAGVRHHESKIK